MYITVHTENWLITADRLWQKQTHPLVREGATPKDETEIVKK
jgi:hypothetical protein